MTDFRAKYKQKGLSFGDLERSRITRASERDGRRKEIRAENFSKLRPLIQNANPETPGKTLLPFFIEAIHFFRCNPFFFLKKVTYCLKIDLLRLALVIFVCMSVCQ